jgi:hypothetical protein
MAKRKILRNVKTGVTMGYTETQAGYPDMEVIEIEVPEKGDIAPEREPEPEPAPVVEKAASTRKTPVKKKVAKKKAVKAKAVPEPTLDDLVGDLDLGDDD